MSAIAISSATLSNGKSVADSVKEFISKLTNSGVDKECLIKASNVAWSQNQLFYKKADAIFGNADRITWTFEVESQNESDCNYFHDVRRYLNHRGYSIVSYIDGTCSVEGSSRVQKIGKVLTKAGAPSSLINGFANSPIRAGKNKKLCLTLSRNVYDILSMSTFRGWRSCMAVDGGNFHYVGADLSHGTLIVYAHEENDTNIEKPSGRVLLKPVFVPINNNEDFVILYAREGSVYGTIPQNVNSKITEITKVVNSHIMTETNLTGFVSGVISDSCYKDSIRTNQTFFNTGSDINLDTYDFSNMSSSEVMTIIESYFENKWMALANPTLINYISYGDISNSIAAGDSAITDSILEYLNKNPDIASAQSYLASIFRYMDYGHEKRHLCRQIAKFDNLVTNMSSSVIYYIVDEYATAELLEKLKETNKAYQIYSMGSITDPNYTPTGILSDFSDWGNMRGCLQGSNLAKEINLEVSKINYGAIYGISQTNYSAYVSWDMIKDWTLRDKVFAFSNAYQENSDVCDSILEEMNTVYCSKLTKSDLYEISNKYQKAYQLIGFKREFSLPLMVDGVVNYLA